MIDLKRIDGQPIQPISKEDVLAAQVFPCLIGNREFPPKAARIFAVKTNTFSRSGTEMLTLYSSYYLGAPSSYEVAWLDSGWFAKLSVMDLMVASAIDILGWSGDRVCEWTESVQPTVGDQLSSYAYWDDDLRLSALEGLNSLVLAQEKPPATWVQLPADWAVEVLNDALEHEEEWTHLLKFHRPRWASVRYESPEAKGQYKSGS